MVNPILKPGFKIESHLTENERLQLYKLALQARSALEIGSFLGASAACISAAFQKNKAGRLICIDTWQNDAMTEGKRDTWLEFNRNIAQFTDFIIPVRGWSTKVIGEVEKKLTTVDLLFIDGDHSYDGVYADWSAYKKFLTSGSVVVFHDYGWAEGVKKVVEECVKQVTTDYGQLPNMWWGRVS